MRFLTLSSINKNLAFLVIVAIVPALAILVNAGLEQRKSSLEHAQHELLLLSRSLAESPKEVARSTRQTLSTLALLPQIQSGDVQASNRILKDILEKNPIYHNISLIALDGSVLASGLPFSKVNLADRKHFQYALASKQFSPGNLIVTRTRDSHPAFPFAYPVLDAAGNPVAVLAAVIDTSYFSNIYDPSFPSKLSVFSITDRNGNSLFTFSPDKKIDYPAQLIKATSRRIPGQTKKEKIFINLDSDSESEIVLIEPIQLDSLSDPFMYLWAGLSETSIFRTANSVLARSLLFMFIVALMSFLVAWIIGRNAFLTPIKNLVNTAHRFAEGNLDFRNELPSNPKEIRALGKAFHDMAEHLRDSYATLNENEARFRLLVENAPDAILVQTGGCLDYLNPAAVQLFGANSDEDLIGTPMVDYFHPDCQESVRERIRLINQEKVTIPTMHRTCLRMDGTSVDVESSAVPLVYDGRDGGLVFIRDISDKINAKKSNRSLEEQLHQVQKIESIGQLAGGVAHDFNNMLGVILGHAEMALRKAPPSSPFISNLEEISNAAQRSADLTRQLLTFARKQVISPKVLDVNETIDGMLKMLKRLIGENIQLSWFPTSNLWTVRADPSQVDQILANLCVNARDAISGAGKITIKTANSTFDEKYCTSCPFIVLPGDYVCISVSDDGCGMDKKTQAHIFEPFYTTKEVGSGTGLGLSTVYGAVKQNHGFLTVYSEPGLGTVFNVYFPRTSKSVEAKQETSEKPLLRGNETILLVEDDEMLLNMVTAMLEESGYTVLAASTTVLAQTLAKDHPGPINLLVSDMIMPVMNGKELAEKLMPLRPDMKVLFLSGYSADIISVQGIVEDGIHFLQKPFSFEALTSKVREVLSDH